VTLDALFAASPEPQLVVDAAFVIVAANAAWIAYAGPTEIGRDVREVFPERTEMLASLARAPDRIDVTPIEGLGEAIGEHRLRGRSVAIVVEGALRWIVHRIEDVSELVRVSQWVNVELEAFRYSVSHDVRFPLRVIDGFSRALEEDNLAQLDPDGRTYLASIRKGVAKLETMVTRLDELLRLAMAPMTIVEVDLSALTRELIAATRLKYTHVVKVEIADGLVMRGDRKLIEILLTALIDNAFKFTGRTEAATIAIGREGEALFVRDNGDGFNSKAARLFSPFRRLHAAAEFPGDGVGLAIVHRAVARHGGRVWAEATPGAGATLYLTLSEPRSPR